MDFRLQLKKTKSALAYFGLQKKFPVKKANFMATDTNLVEEK